MYFMRLKEDCSDPCVLNEPIEIDFNLKNSHQFSMLRFDKQIAKIISTLK